jgi:hypothetical protein
MEPTFFRAAILAKRTARPSHLAVALDLLAH